MVPHRRRASSSLPLLRTVGETATDLRGCETCAVAIDVTASCRTAVAPHLLSLSFAPSAAQPNDKLTHYQYMSSLDWMRPLMADSELSSVGSLRISLMEDDLNCRPDWLEMLSAVRGAAKIFMSREKEYPYVKNATAQAWAFKSTATIMNTGINELKEWKMFIGFQHQELLVSPSNAVLVDGNELPAPVGTNGTYLSGYPQMDLKTSIETAGDLTQIQDGDLSLSYDVIQVYENNYLAQVTIENNNPLGRLDHWNLTWEWMRGEFIYTMRGAYTHQKDYSDCIYGVAGQYYQDLDFSQVMNCQKKPVIADLPRDRAKDEKIGNLPYCCRNGSLLPTIMNATKARSIFQVQVYKLPPDLNKTALYPPENWKIVGVVNPEYKCGTPLRVDATEFPDPSGLQATTSAIASWQVNAAPGFEKAYSFNGTLLEDLNDTVFLQGLPGLNYLIGETNGTNPAKDPKVPVATVLFLTILKPKQPRITTPAVYLEYIKWEPFPFHLNVTLGIIVTIDNRNYGSYKYENSTAYLSYHGNVTGEAPIGEDTIPARGKHNISTNVVIQGEKIVENPNFVIDFATGSLNLTSSTTLHGKATVLKLFKTKATSHCTCNISVLVEAQNVTSVCSSKVKF
ncbi:hypothetical protein RJ640_001157 [Escallonia rubra]|uniref:Uncharacterized protein n=1 Tax=Escallonia rubra TaxID=112253 RepID=A0AA88QRW1_9ASTE|nr:hypothetical protein RJ640_001157 [Escallonia rubra]